MGKYKVTGKLRSGRQFKAIHTDDLNYAMNINLYDGTVWKKQSNGKWKSIKRVYK